MTDIPSNLRRPLIELLLSLADDKFILGHRNADWTGVGPILEEDIAFSSIAQDELAHASALYEFLVSLTGDNANRLAYGRRPEEYRCAALVEAPDDFDWAVALVRQFYCDHFDMLRLGRLRRSSYAPLAALAGKMLAEESIHIGHADSWVIRLGSGTTESRERVQSALDRLAPLAVQLAEPPAGVAQLEASGVYPADAQPLPDAWRDALLNVTQEAGLHLTLAPPPAGFKGGRGGVHSTAFVELLAELTEVYRLEPDAAW
jgi:ring-1,2-phenylacetyl-CoA epoxidase subunit PaaC